MTKSQLKRTTLPPHVQQQLLFLARQSIADHLFHIQTSSYVLLDPAANLKSGAFVTLFSQGKLRGCIGMVEAIEKLPVVIREMSVAAATRDPRFDPVAPEELVHLEIEISILSELEEIAGPEDIEIGTHGLLVRSDVHQGLLLPQVASNAGWSAEEFLSATCRKAGLPALAWQQDEVKLFVFTATIFAEHNFQPAHNRSSHPGDS